MEFVVRHKALAFAVCVALCVGLFPLVEAPIAQAEDQYTVEWDSSSSTLTITVNSDMTMDSQFFRKNETLNAAGVPAPATQSYYGTELEPVERLVLKGDGALTISGTARIWGLEEFDASAANLIAVTGELIFTNSKSSFKEVDLGSKITILNMTSFQNCGNLRNLDLSGCTRLTTITDTNLVRNCLSGTIIFPASLKNFDADMSEVTSSRIVFSSGTHLERICDGAFARCSFESIELPEVDDIGTDVLAGNRNLKEVSMPFGNTLPDSTFTLCSALESVVLTCAPSSAAINESVQAAVGDDVAVTNELHQVDYGSINQGSSAECSVCGKRLSLDAPVLDEGDEFYQNLVEAAGGRQVLSAQNVICDMEEFDGRSSKGTFAFTPDVPEGYTKGQLAKAVLLFSDGTIGEVKTSDSTVNEVPKLRFVTQKCPVAFAIVLEEQPVQQVTVNFDANEGSAVNPVTVNANSTVEQPANPTREGYTFTGWFTDESCTQAFDFSTPITANITLYAGWQKIEENPPASQQVTVTFDSNDGSAVGPVTLDVNGTVAKPADPTREGYTFTGWFTDESCTQAFDFSTPITDDITLYAGWKASEDKTEGNPTKTTGAATTTTKASPKTGDENAVLGMSLAGAAVALAALGGTLGYRRRKSN